MRLFLLRHDKVRPPVGPIAGAFFALLALLLAGPAARADEIAAPAPIIAVGDLHGDYDAFAAILAAAGLIDESGDWSGGDAIFVQLGDVPDRGPQSRKIIERLMALEKQAPRKGGRVVALIGNHEAMNVTGDLRYVSAEEYAAFATRKSKRLRDAYLKKNFAAIAAYYRRKDATLSDDAVKIAFEKDTPPGYLEHRLAWSPKGKVGAWVASHDAIAIIGDSLFVHGGVSATYAKRQVDEINKSVRAALNVGGGAILEDALGPLWFRGLSSETAGGLADLEAALSAYGVKRIVTGHTPQLAGVKALYDGRVIIADTGASKAYGGTRSFVRIEGDKVTANDNGVETTLSGGQ